MAECICTLVRCILSPPSMEPSDTEPYYTRSVWHVAECRHTQVRCSPHPSIEPSGIELYYTRSVWLPLLLPQLNLVVQSTESYYTRSVWPPPSIELSGTEPYYTRSVWHVEECRHTQVRCTLPLPHLNLVVQSPTTPGQFHMWKNANVPSSDVPPPTISPSGTEPYYTRSVCHVEECVCTQVRCTPSPQWNLVVQSPTTPGQFDMWKNADIPRSDVPPIDPSATEPYYTLSVWHVVECWHTQVRCTHLLIKPSGIEPYYTWSNECKISDETYTPLLIKPSATEP